MADFEMLVRIWPIPAGVGILSLVGPLFLKISGRKGFAATLIVAWLLVISLTIFTGPSWEPTVLAFVAGVVAVAIASLLPLGATAIAIVVARGAKVQPVLQGLLGAVIGGSTLPMAPALWLMAGCTLAHDCL